MSHINNVEHGRDGEEREKRDGAGRDGRDGTLRPALVTCEKLLGDAL